MKQNTGELSEADLKARRRFWNKKSFFGEPTKKQIERSSLQMQKLVKAFKTFSLRKLGEYALQNILVDFSPMICTQCGVLANQTLIMQYQPLKYFSYGFSKKNRRGIR